MVFMVEANFEAMAGIHSGYEHGMISTIKITDLLTTEKGLKIWNNPGTKLKNDSFV